MNFGTLIALAAVLLVVGGAVYSVLKNKKKGGCSGCSGCGCACSHAQSEPRE